MMPSTAPVRRGIRFHAAALLVVLTATCERCLAQRTRLHAPGGIAGADTAGTPTGVVYDVCVIGAGMAGVEAVKTLEENEVKNIKWIEGRDYVGGRMKTRNFGGLVVEDGANWIQGDIESPIYDYATERSIDLDFTEQDWDDVVTFDLGGYKEDNGRWIKDKDIRWGDFEEAYQCTDNIATSAGVKPEDSIRDVISSAECGWTCENGLDEAVEWYTLDYEDAYRPKDTSAVGTFPRNPLTDKEKGYGQVEHFVIDQEGFNKIPRFIQENLLQTVPELNTKVKKVVIDTGSHATVTARKVGMGTDTMYNCKKVLNTVPIGVHNKETVADGGIEYEPSDEWNLQRAAMRRYYAMASYHKYFFKFGEKFWSREQIFMMALTQERRGESPIWQNLDTRGFFQGSGILMATLTTDVIEKFEAWGWNEVQIRDRLLGDIVQVFLSNGKKMSQGEIDKEIETLVSDEGFEFAYYPWLTDEFSFGSYEVPVPGGTMEDFDNFIKPLRDSTDTDNVVYFAGSAICNRFYGFTHGAVLSGQQTANKILKDMGMIDEEPESRCDEGRGDAQSRRLHSSKVRAKGAGRRFL